MNEAYLEADSPAATCPFLSGQRPVFLSPIDRMAAFSATLPRTADLGALESLIREGAELKADIECKTARLREINSALAERATFEGGQKTAHLAGAGYHVTVRLNENVIWDQGRILKFREYLPEEKFVQLFKAVYEPVSKKEIDGFIAHADADLASGLKWCMSVKPGAPRVSYMKLQD